MKGIANINLNDIKDSTSEFYDIYKNRNEILA
jgi:hypothetical protein